MGIKGRRLAAACSPAQVVSLVVSDVIEGEARDIGRMHAAIAREVAGHNRPFSRPVAILPGGETIVTLHVRGCAFCCTGR